MYHLAIFYSGFEPVKQLLESYYAEEREQGAQLCAYYTGEFMWEIFLLKTANCFLKMIYHENIKFF